MDNGALRKARELIKKVLKEEKKRLEKDRILKEDIDEEFRSICDEYIPKGNEYLTDNHRDVAVLYEKLGNNILLVDSHIKCRQYGDLLNSVGFDTTVRTIYMDGVRY